MRRSQRDLPTSPDQARDVEIAKLRRGQPRQGGPKDPNPITANVEPLRLLRGTVNTTGPSIVVGIGWTVARNGTGDVTVTFTVPFSAVPTVTVSGGSTVGGNNRMAATMGVTASTVRIGRCVQNTNVAEDGDIHFTAWGNP